MIIEILHVAEVFVLADDLRYRSTLIRFVTSAIAQRPHGANVCYHMI
jgi:hypothetical protein